MKLIKPSFEIWEQEAGLNGVFRQIERAGRVCYKSEDKITETSAKEFVERMIKSGHGAMLEHGTVYLVIPYTSKEIIKYKNNPYSRVATMIGTHNCVTTNYRVLVENNWLDDLQYICEPTEFHEKRYTVKFICDRGVSHEYVRHRVFSFAQESTRYCNYSKDKFGNELTFIIPRWLSLSNGSYTYDYPNGFTKDGSKWDSKLELNTFLLSLVRSEATYLELIEQGWAPQQARAVLPNSLKTELVMTGFVSDWKRFFRLRSRIAKTGKPHPQAQELADPLMDEFVKRGIMETLL
jgi:thymidylate synthase (FAD)|nr:MAG TPA: Thymidylate synthase complementing protein [Crassvirales sp.]